MAVRVTTVMTGRVFRAISGTKRSKCERIPSTYVFSVFICAGVYKRRRGRASACSVIGRGVYD